MQRDNRETKGRVQILKYIFDFQEDEPILSDFYDYSDSTQKNLT